MEERDPCRGVPARLGGKPQAELCIAPITNQHPHRVFSIFFFLFSVVFASSFPLSQIMRFFRADTVTQSLLGWSH